METINTWTPIVKTRLVAVYDPAGLHCDCNSNPFKLCRGLPLSHKGTQSEQNYNTALQYRYTRSTNEPIDSIFYIKHSCDIYRHLGSDSKHTCSSRLNQPPHSIFAPMVNLGAINKNPQLHYFNQIPRWMDRYRAK